MNRINTHDKKGLDKSLSKVRGDIIEKGTGLKFVRTVGSLFVLWPLLEEEVDEQLEEDEEGDDDVVALLEERAALGTYHSPAPQHSDGLVNVVLRLFDGVNGTLKFTEVGPFFPQSVVVFALVSFAARRVVPV